MLRRDKWWIREIERMQRAHAAERSELLSVIAHLAGRPLPTYEMETSGPLPERELTYAAPEQYPEETWE